jgi:hypothetical protein
MDEQYQPVESGACVITFEINTDFWYCFFCLSVICAYCRLFSGQKMSGQFSSIRKIHENT